MGLNSITHNSLECLLGAIWNFFRLNPKSFKLFIIIHFKLSSFGHHLCNIPKIGPQAFILSILVVIGLLICPFLFPNFLSVHLSLQNLWNLSINFQCCPIEYQYFSTFIQHPLFIELTLQITSFCYDIFKLGI